MAEAREVAHSRGQHRSCLPAESTKCLHSLALCQACAQKLVFCPAQVFAKYLLNKWLWEQGQAWSRGVEKELSNV